MKTHDQKLAELRAASAQLAARRETEFAAIDEAIATHRAADPDHCISHPLANQEAALIRENRALLSAVRRMREADDAAKDSRRLDALLSLDIDVKPADGSGWVLVDWRANPPRTTEHASGRAAIDAALANVRDEPRHE